ncbi:SRPBCC family protein [Pseudonocardiaceae bacterium YIM PH 21723]|nr:SRPBCC family protein [Pseudonocardiaceae bacterium YIM PH 21723]
MAGQHAGRCERDQGPSGGCGMKITDVDLITARAETFVNATPEQIWPLISDISVPPRFSPEAVSTRWVDEKSFIGVNEHPKVGQWETVCFVVINEPDSRFGWAVMDPENPTSTWTFELEPVEGGTRLSQTARLGTGKSIIHWNVERMPDKEARIIERRLSEWQTGLQACVDGIKELAEQAR